MDSPWFGGMIMLVVIVASLVWGWWAFRKSKDKSKEDQSARGAEL